MTTPDPLQILRDKLAEQPLYKKYANTVTSLGGLALSVIWTLIGLGVEIPTETLVGVLVGLGGLTTLGVKFTPNGVTEKQIADIEAYAGRHRTSK